MSGFGEHDSRGADAAGAAPSSTTHPTRPSKPGARTRTAEHAASSPASSRALAAPPSAERVAHVLELLERQADRLAAALADRDFHATRTAAETCRSLLPSLRGALADAARDDVDGSTARVALEQRAARLQARLDELLPQAPPSSLGLGIDLTDPSADVSQAAQWVEEQARTEAKAATTTARQPAARAPRSTISRAPRRHTAGRVPYRHLPGTYRLEVESEWILGAHDLQDEGARISSSSRTLELLEHLRSTGLLWWASDEELHRAATEISLARPPADKETYTLSVSLSVFRSVGLPPGTDAMTTVRGDGGLEIVMRVSGAEGGDDARGGNFTLTRAHKELLLDSLARYTGLPVRPTRRAKILRRELTASLGNSAVYFVLSAGHCELLFGPAYPRWLAERARRKSGVQADDAVEADTEASAQGGFAPGGTTGAAASATVQDASPAAGQPVEAPVSLAAASELSPEEIKWARGWLAQHLPSATPAAPDAPPAALPLDRHTLAALRRIDEHPRALVIAEQLRQLGGETPLTRRELDRAIDEAVLEAERSFAAGDPPELSRRTRPPTYDMPVPGRLMQRHDRVISGERVRYEVELEMPMALSETQIMDRRWRTHEAECDWFFERKGPGAPARQHLRSHGKAPFVEHTLALAPGETRAVWTLEVFVRHNFFRPARFTTEIEVKSEEQHLSELRRAAFDELGPRMEREHDFDTSLFNELFGDQRYDQGLLLTGTIDPNLQRLSLEERGAKLTSEIRRYEQLLEVLRKSNSHADAIAACRGYLERLRDARDSLQEDGANDWIPFEVRGFFLGKGSRLSDGALEIFGAAKPMRGARGNQYMRVQLRDLSRRIDAGDRCYEEDAETFAAAFEQAFVLLCKEYPAGRVSLLGDHLDGQARPTGKTLGFELDTGTEWEDAKDTVWSPNAELFINTALSLLMILAPMTTPVALPALIAYNTAPVVDSLVAQWQSGRLTASSGSQGIGQILLNLLPAMASAQVLRTSRMAFAMFETVNWGGQALVMTMSVHEQIAKLQDQDIRQMAQIYAEYVALEQSTHGADPRLVTLRAQLDERAQQVSERSRQVWSEAVQSFAIATIPVQVATHLKMVRDAHLVNDLQLQGWLHSKPDAALRYDRERGRIVGDERQFHPPTLEPVLAERDAHLRELATQLAERLGVPGDRISIRPDSELRLWEDGQTIEVRYAPGTPPERALETWRKLAEAGATDSAADLTPTTPRRRRRGEDDEPRSDDDSERDGAAAREHEPTHQRPRDHDGDATREDEPTERARPAGDTEHVVSATPIAGSRYQGRRGAENADACRQAAGRAIPAAAAQVEKIVSIDPATDPDTFVLRLVEGAPISVRVSAGPLEGNLPARTVVNPSKVGTSKLAPYPSEASAAGGAAAPEAVTVEGRYVIQLSSSLEPAHLERALVHELTVIVAERDHARARQQPPGDILRAGAPVQREAALGPRDRGHLAELELLAERAERSATAHDEAALHEAQRELLALVDHLGLRAGTEGAAARRALVTPHLSERARQALTRLGARDAELPATARGDLEAMRAQAARDHADAAQRAHEQRPLHELPIARKDGRPVVRVSAEEAAQLALRAERARAAASVATLARLRAEAAQLAPSGRFPAVESPQLGGGAALAARVPERLFVDRRGRWQADPSEHIAQTASQLRGLRDAGIGDPFQFAGPDERVPLAAVRFWEDSIAAQGPVIDGSASLQLSGDGRLLLHVDPSDGSPRLTLEVTGTPLVATGFPPEHMPGAPRNLTPDQALTTIAKELESLRAAATEDPALASRLTAAHDELAAIGDTKQGRGAREPELAKAREILQRHQLEPLVGKDKNADALKMILAGDVWHSLRTNAPGRVLLGDEANLSSLDPTSTDDWVIAGTGGTGVSAAEIIFHGNSRAHVTMAGRNAPPGLLENDQFRSLLAKHGDAASVAAVASHGGPTLPPGDGRLTVLFGVDAGIPQTENGQFRIAGSGAFDAKDPLVGGGYIAAVGRADQAPPALAAAIEQAKRDGLTPTLSMNYDGDGRYLGYQITIRDPNGRKIRAIDVTGAASRFVPWELMPATEVDVARKQLERAGLMDAPPEGGNFDGGFVSSAKQSASHAKAQRENEQNTRVDRNQEGIHE